MTIIKEMTTRLRKAARYITKHGWTQGTEKDSEGRVCATGAIRLCAPVDGDFFLIREVLRGRGRAEDWNDAAKRTANQVIKYLATTKITDADMFGAFGPQWVEVVSLVRRAAMLTPAEVGALAAAGAAAWTAAGAAEAAAGAAAWTAAGAAGAAGDAAGAAAGAAARAAGATGAAARAAGAAGATGAAARALVVRDLIGQGGFTQAHYDTLTGPWRRTIGPVHPDDVVRVGDKQ